MNQFLDIARKTAFAFAAVLTLSACPQKTAVWVARGSTAGNLTFHLGNDRGNIRTVDLGMLRVRKCGPVGETPDNGAVWSVYAEQRAQSVSVVQYGKTPAGFRAVAQPAELSAGCYSVEISGGATTKFVVSSNGTIEDKGEKLP